MSERLWEPREAETPSLWGEKPIQQLARLLEADEEELLLLAEKIPEDIKQRVIERPDAFRNSASLDDEALNRILKQIEKKGRKK